MLMHVINSVLLSYKWMLPLVAVRLWELGLFYLCIEKFWNGKGDPQPGRVMVWQCCQWHFARGWRRSPRV
jgi:hypothetical protein